MEEKDEVFQLSLSIVRQRYVFRNIKPAKCPNTKFLYD